MRKIIIAMCGMCVICGAFAGEPDKYREPIPSGFADKWLDGYSGAYSKSLPTTGIYPNIETQLKDKDNGHNSHNGTFADEGAIMLWAARNIYEHGAYICAVQIQSANKNGYKYAWFDYYWKSDSSSWKCKTMCESGWSGIECRDSTKQCAAGEWSAFGTVPGLIAKESGSDTGYKYRHTTEMEVLSFKNEKGGTSDAGVVRQTHHIVLGVVAHAENGVFVSPIKIIGERGKTGGGISSWIESAASNNRLTLLCADGYIANNSNTGCVKNPSCTGVDEWCDGYKTGFKSDIHREIINGNCKEYRCVEDNYGFASDAKRDECIACDTAIRTGVNSAGLCEKCSTGQCFNASQKQCGGCTEIPKLKIERGPNYDSENRECWRKTNPDKFWGCVMCPDEDQCYNKNSSGKYECGTCPTE